MRSPVSKKPWKRSYDRVDDDDNRRRPKFQPSFKRRRSVERFEKFRDRHASNSGIRERSSGGRFTDNARTYKRVSPLKHLNYGSRRREFSDGDGRLDSKEKPNDADLGELKTSSPSIPREMSQSYSWERRPSDGRGKDSFSRDHSFENEEQIKRENVLRSPANHKGDWRLGVKAKSNDGAVSGILKSSSQLSVLPSRERRPSKGGKKVSFHQETSLQDVVSQKVLKNTSEENSSKCQRENGDLRRHQDDEKMVRSFEENRKCKIAEQLSTQVKDCEAIPGNCGHQEQVAFQHLFNEKIIVVNTQAAEARAEQPYNNDEQRCFYYVADDDRIQKLKQLKNDCIVLVSDRYHVHDSRRRVMRALDLFKDVYAVRFKAYKAEQNHGSAKQKIDVRTAMALKREGKWANYGRDIVGNVPGVYIGDQFRFRAELPIVGLHGTFYSGIHYVKIQGKNYATSIVNSGRYKNQSISPENFIYVGHGGNPRVDGKEPVDQELKCGNLALKNSRDKGVPVRVIRACCVQDENSNTNNKRYIFEGLFEVTNYWQERAQHGKMVFKFELHRMSNQPSCTPQMSVRPRRVGTWFHRQTLKEGRRPFGIGRPFLNGKRTRGVFKRLLRCRAVDHVVVDDVSRGKETVPIRVVSDIYAERPLPFSYIANMIYPRWYHPWEPLGCHCTNGCTDSRDCFCAFKNGGEIPYNTQRAIIKPKPVIHECGPACKCPPSCRNRVSQQGIQHHLEIFRKKPSGWGVRSRDYISSGSFICEFVGELIDKKQAKQRIDHLQYFCPIANSENPAFKGDSSSGYMYGDGYILDAACSGNVARFINRSSSSPNLYVQNVLYEDDYECVPHIMLFACKNIPPMQEFTYDYNCSRSLVSC
ncbi:PREDICTED: histone-lysine N-methyltransferase, H3 lysine-9 specific SUVH6-like [Ipomoea nil]|uniref:histone-lysine N-methyltransferase, H3 lysine-9 specific SUVH6-like n=1 Tax=Ipomoea nil TaxID=35883 RepID=UPI0009009B74|nr:PREDICTED: histone-lysine N-methyltransferase, H3 lysine-9 specific SUVH6-like [Ipomoea nil]